ncbi:chemotaxis protein CheW [Marinicellulosiphila megalodicopiae]|uniref:chemotaxis protein CheW n=1 Tax=Marinicellulosiphila megalodicopiae TaxID=2724896 RepID=UPI003BB11B7D
MGLDADEEILQDFLVEAGEILELLSEQLIELEQSPDNADLLNAIFRGFHTVKGGAGFLQLDPLVDCCHVAENIFDLLRNQKQVISADLMDAVLRSLDTIIEMFETVKQGEMPDPAPAELIKELEKYAIPIGSEPKPEPNTPIMDEPKEISIEPPSSSDSTAVVEEFSNSQEDITDEEFERLLDALGSDNTTANKTPEVIKDSDVNQTQDDVLFGSDDLSISSEKTNSDEITEDEFEALLDELDSKKEDDATTTAKVSAQPSNSDDITDEEFEKLLDDLHGVGKISLGDQEAGNSSSASNNQEPELASESQKTSAAPVHEIKKTELQSSSTQAVTKPESIEQIEAIENTSTLKPKSPAGTNPKSQANTQETTVRVDTKRLDDIMNMVGELVLVRNRLVRLGTQLEDEVLAKAVANLNVVTADLQTSVMKTRMQPIKKVFGRFPRVVRDLARNLKKEVNLELVGEETDLDKNLVDALADPLVHLVRNAVDHGIELPSIREANDKPRMGLIRLSAQQEGDHILLSIEDDGAGMDANVLRAIAVEKGLMDQEAADRLPDSECYALIFAPGFSTKKEISDISGRGVGMDVVKTKISQLNGSLDIDSVLGRGSKISIKVPLTLAIMPTLMVMLDEQAFALPLVNVNEIFHLDLRKTSVVDGREVVIVRGKPLPLFYLKRWLIQGSPDLEEGDEGHVVVVSVGNQKVGFVVDQLVGQEEVVIKPLGKMLHGTDGMAGATITGDGRIALILDVPSMLNRYA